MLRARHGMKVYQTQLPKTKPRPTKGKISPIRGTGLPNLMALKGTVNHERVPQKYREVFVL